MEYVDSSFDRSNEEKPVATKNRRPPVSHQSTADDDDGDRQMEMQLLDPSLPSTKIEQPRKMAKSKKKASDGADAAGGGGDSSSFGLTVEQLKELMELRGKDLMERINSSDYNGISGILEKLHVDGTKGLESQNTQDFEQRRAVFGKNEIPPKPMKSFLRLCWDAFHDMLLVILLICAIVSIGLSFYQAPSQPSQSGGDSSDHETNLEWIEGVAILVAVFVVVIVTAFNDWRKERQFRGLQNKIEKDQQASVVRDNKIQQVPISELVVGDLCFIKYGDLLPADGLVVQASDLKVDESSLTGETDLIKKTEEDDIGLLSGTQVMEGSGRMVVTGVGLNSQVGTIMSLLGATGDGSKKKNKKDKKDKKEKKKDKDQPKEKRPKPSKTKVSPDKSKPDDHSSDEDETKTKNNTASVHTEIETKQSSSKSSQNPRVHKLPPLQNAPHDKEEAKPKTNEQDKKPDKNESQVQKSNQDDQDKKSNKNEGKDQKPDSDDDDEDKNKEKNQKPNNDDQKKNNNEGKDQKPNSDDQDNKSNKSEGKDKKPSAEKDEKKKSSDQNDNRSTTTSPVQSKMSDKNGKSSKDDQKKDESKGDKDDVPKDVPPIAAAAAAESKDGDQSGGSGEGKHKSVLQAKLTKLALFIGYIGMGAAVLTLICLILRFCIEAYVVEGRSASANDVSYFIYFLIQAITVVVVSVPEGLPLAVTLALAYAVRKMMTDNNLVRHLDACETMGNASTICSDKTGTLTTNRMTVVQCYVTGKHHDKLPKSEEINKDLLPLIYESISVNTNYTSKIEAAKEEEGGLPKQVGNKTECALLDLVQKWNGSYDKIREEIPEKKLVKVYTFNSARKMMSTIIEREEGFRVYTKGASEMVLAKCKSIIGEDGKPTDLTDDQKKKLTSDIIEKMANDGLRTICVAYKDLGKEKQNWDDEDKIVTDLVCILLVGIEDPVRPEVPEAIEKCQRAGVTVRMVTGDNLATARSIATKCGIIKPNDNFLVLEGKEFNKRIRDSSGKVSQEKLDQVWPNLRVLARSSPQDKYNLVNGIVESCATDHREVVAVTGDGTNDGPALKRADVGFAMGIQGTDVAKQASDIILTDDNFSSIVKAMMWGRNVYDCIAKFLQFQLTANLSAGVLSVVSAAAISSVPLRAVQMLWVNLVMDTLASLALATEPPTEELLNRKPYGRTKSIISPLMLRSIFGQSLYQLVIMFVILYAGPAFLGVTSTVQLIQTNQAAGREASAQFTMVFNAFVLMTLFNEINARKLHGERNVFKGIHRNPFFYCIWLGCFAAQILIVTFGGVVFSCYPLTIAQWGWSMLFGVGSLAWGQILIFIPTEPFGRCFAAMYPRCCPWCYRKQQRKRAETGEGDDQSPRGEPGKRVPSPRKSEHDAEGVIPYSTIGQLTTATVVAEPPPAFAKFMFRKSVDRLNSEFRVINEFRTRLDVLKDKKYEEVIENKRNSHGNVLDA